MQPLSQFFCECCDKRVTLWITVEGHKVCNGCFEKLKPVTVTEQIRNFRRRNGLPARFPWREGRRRV